MNGEMLVIREDQIAPHEKVRRPIVNVETESVRTSLKDDE
jgi:hypothetical protein